MGGLKRGSHALTMTSASVVSASSTTSCCCAASTRVLTTSSLCAVGGGVVVGDLLAGLDVACRDQDDAATEQAIRVTGVVDEIGRFGLRRSGEEELLVDLQATDLLAGGQQVELVAGHTAPTERGNDLAGADRLAGDAAESCGSGSQRSGLWSKEADTHRYPAWRAVPETSTC